MCLTATFKTRDAARKAKKNSLIAKEDINVFKILTRGNFAPFKSFLYEKGMHYYQEGKPFGIGKIEKPWYSSMWRFDVEQGLHSYTSKSKAEEHLSFYINIKIVKMIIPKGALYYIGINGDVVSSELIYP